MRGQVPRLIAYLTRACKRLNHAISSLRRARSRSPGLNPWLQRATSGRARSPWSCRRPSMPASTSSAASAPPSRPARTAPGARPPPMPPAGWRSTRATPPASRTWGFIRTPSCSTG
jgi:hypothetical protein